MPSGRRAVFPRAHRVLSARDFSAVLGGDCRTGDRLVTVAARPNRFGHARLGISVSKRVARKAVIRNRIKRHIREAFRHRETTLDGYDLIILARADAARVGGEEIRRALQHQWQRIEKRCARS